MAPSSDILPLLGCHDANRVWVWVMGFLLMVLFWVFQFVGFRLILVLIFLVMISEFGFGLILVWV